MDTLHDSFSHHENDVETEILTFGDEDAKMEASNVGDAPESGNSSADASTWQPVPFAAAFIPDRVVTDCSDSLLLSGDVPRDSHRIREVLSGTPEKEQQKSPVAELGVESPLVASILHSAVQRERSFLRTSSVSLANAAHPTIGLAELLRLTRPACSNASISVSGQVMPITPTYCKPASERKIASTRPFFVRPPVFRTVDGKLPIPVNPRKIAFAYTVPVALMAVVPRSGPLVFSAVPGSVAFPGSTPRLPSARPLTKTCRCSRSMCLMLYCECFRAGLLCGSDCGCKDCCNNSAHEEKRSEAVNAIKLRDSTAFDHIGHPRHPKRCNCRKSGCLKNYCECFMAGRVCGDLCKCSNCKNVYGNPERTEAIQGRTSPRRKPQPKPAVVDDKVPGAVSQNSQACDLRETSGNPSTNVILAVTETDTEQRLSVGEALPKKDGNDLGKPWSGNRLVHRKRKLAPRSPCRKRSRPIEPVDSSSLPI